MTIRQWFNDFRKFAHLFFPTPPTPLREPPARDIHPPLYTSSNFSAKATPNTTREEGDGKYREGFGRLLYDLCNPVLPEGDSGEVRVADKSGGVEVIWDKFKVTEIKPRDWPGARAIKVAEDEATGDAWEKSAAKPAALEWEGSRGAAAFANPGEITHPEKSPASPDGLDRGMANLREYVEPLESAAYMNRWTLGRLKLWRSQARFPNPDEKEPLTYDGYPVHIDDDLANGKIRIWDEERREGRDVEVAL